MNPLDVFAKDVGVWDADVVVTLPSGASRSTGVMTSVMACGGAWLVSDYKGDGEFNGHGMWTYDKSKEKYVGVWGDNMMQFVAPGEGTWDPAAQAMTFFYEANLGGKAMRWKQTTTTVDADTLRFESFVPFDAPAPMMRVTYRRRRP